MFWTYPKKYLLQNFSDFGPRLPIAPPRFAFGGSEHIQTFITLSVVELYMPTTTHFDLIFPQESISEVKMEF